MNEDAICIEGRIAHVNTPAMFTFSIGPEGQVGHC